jgi:drug/metabolite transporter (DMT)-like permease
MGGERKAELVLLSLVIWLAISSASVLVKLSGATPEACAFWRLLLSLPLIRVIGSITGSTSLGRYRLVHLVSGLALALHFVLWMHSLFLVSVYTSTLLVTLYPIYSLVIEATVFHKRPRVIQVVGVLASTILLAMYLGFTGLELNLGVVEALLGGVFAAVYFTSGYYARSKLGESTMAYTLKSYSTATVFIGLVSVVRGANLYDYPLSTYVYFILLATVPMILGHTLMNYLLSRYTASLVTLVSFGEPYGAGLLAYLLLGEVIGVNQLILGSLILFTVFSTIVYAGKE